MYGFFEGKIEYTDKNTVCLAVGGIGYNITVSDKTMLSIPSIGEIIRLYTYFHVKEDEQKLYGFLSKEELDIFKMIINVNGIGPKGGLAILSALAIDEFVDAVVSGDAKAISKAPGIGGKTAERLIIDMRDKVEPTAGLIKHLGTQDNNQSPNTSEALEALIELGYGKAEALKAVKSFDTTDMSTSTIIKNALKYL